MQSLIITLQIYSSTFSQNIKQAKVRFPLGRVCKINFQWSILLTFYSCNLRLYRLYYISIHFDSRVENYELKVFLGMTTEWPSLSVYKISHCWVRVWSMMQNSQVPTNLLIKKYVKELFLLEKVLGEEIREGEKSFCEGTIKGSVWKSGRCGPRQVDLFVGLRSISLASWGHWNGKDSSTLTKLSINPSLIPPKCLVNTQRCPCRKDR